MTQVNVRNWHETCFVTAQPLPSACCHGNLPSLLFLITYTLSPAPLFPGSWLRCDISPTYSAESLNGPRGADRRRPFHSKRSKKSLDTLEFSSNFLGTVSKDRPASSALRVPAFVIATRPGDRSCCHLDRQLYSTSTFAFARNLLSSPSRSASYLAFCNCVRSPVFTSSKLCFPAGV